MMTDVVDKATRSRMMSGIRDKNTSPEMIVRRFLHARGFRYRLHVRHLPGRPDMVFPKYQSVVMVHGCFWHQHRDCKDAVMPKSNRRFWKAKLDGNRARDKRNAAALTKSGWRWAVIWECALRNGKSRKMPPVLESLARWLRAGRR
jgi:DNA mismatch endonuclease (patch repair protein)